MAQATIQTDPHSRLLFVVIACSAVTGAIGGALRSNDPPESSFERAVEAHNRIPLHAFLRAACGAPVGFLLGGLLGGIATGRWGGSAMMGLVLGLACGGMGDICGSAAVGLPVGAIFGPLLCLRWGLFR